MIIKAVLALFCACLLIGCKSSIEERPHPPQTSTLDAAGREFEKRLHCPYQASRSRRQRIEHALEKIYLRATEEQVLAVLGPPDIKEYVAGYPPEIPPFEKWDYIHTLERPLGPGYGGKRIIFYFRETRPRTVDEIEPYGFKVHPRR